MTIYGNFASINYAVQRVATSFAPCSRYAVIAFFHERPALATDRADRHGEQWRCKNGYPVMPVLSKQALRHSSIQYSNHIRIRGYGSILRETLKRRFVEGCIEFIRPAPATSIGEEQKHGKGTPETFLSNFGGSGTISAKSFRVHLRQILTKRRKNDKVYMRSIS